MLVRVPLPVVVVTMGDAAGIGPEIVAKALLHPGVRAACRPLLVGEPNVFARGAKEADADLRFRAIASADDAVFDPAEPEVVVPAGISVDGVALGEVDARAGAAAAACLVAAYELVADGAAAAVVSAPLNKAALHAAGYDYPDEVAFLAAETGNDEPVLIGVVGDVHTVSVTLHVPLRAVPDLLTRDRVVRHTAILHETISALGERPRLALAGLNPHAGEGGLLGREEIDVLAPAVEEAQARGIDVIGPIAPDTVFPRAFSGEFNGVVCLYHDQANIARKLMGIGDGASIFLGLPAVLATTAHGTAYDIAGTGRADPASLLRAIREGAALAVAAPAVTANG